MGNFIFPSNIRTTHDLGQQKDFNSWLRQSGTNFTYFVPTDAAWARLRHEEPALFSSLRAESGYLAQQTLERHLVVGEGLDMAELTERRRVGVVRGGDLVIRRVQGSNMTVVTRYGILARVVEADIVCTNGFIHLIDRVIVKVRSVIIIMVSNDPCVFQPPAMTLGSALRPSPGSSTVLLLAILVLYLIKTVPCIKLVI